jgi:hypothetical protein
MTTLEQRCRRLVKKWKAHPRYYYSELCIGELLAILPKRKAKKGAKR